MSERIPAEQDRVLARRLRREAMANWPAFSETLHNRILAAVQQRRDSAAVTQIAKPAILWPRYRLAALATAACLLVVVVFSGRFAQRGPQQEVAHVNTSPSIPALAPTDATRIALTGVPLIDALADDAALQLDAVVIATSLSPQSADLAHDTRLAAQILLQRLPVDMDLIAGL